MIPKSYKNNKETTYSNSTNINEDSLSDRINSAVIHHLTSVSDEPSYLQYIHRDSNDYAKSISEFIESNSQNLFSLKTSDIKINDNETKKIIEKETKELRDNLAKLLDLKIKILPPFSSGIYLVEFENLKPYEMEKLLKMLQENINKRYNNDSIILVGINKIKDITETYEDEIDKEIKRLQKLKKELKDIRFIC